MQAWEQFLDTLEKDLGKAIVKNWLRSLKIIDYDARNLYLQAKDSFQLTWFEEHIRAKAETLLVNNNNRPIIIHIGLEEKKIAPSKKGKKKKEEFNPPKIDITFDELNSDYTFDKFIAFPKAIARAFLLESVTQLGTFNPIYLYGNAGTGKTHLLTAFAHAVQHNGRTVRYVRSDTFTEHVVSAIRNGEMSKFRESYRSADILIVDDVHSFSKKWATQEEFFHTFNSLHLAGKQIILSANCAPNELEHLEARLISRFEWGVVLQLEIPKKEELAEILKLKCCQLDCPLHSKIEEFFLNTFGRNPKVLVRALEALVLRLHTQQNQLTTTQLTVISIQQLLQDLIREEECVLITPDQIISSVAAHFGIKVDDILGKSQTREYVFPRQIAMYLCRNQLKMPFTKIGDFFAKDHSTVMTSVKAIQQNIDKQEQATCGAFYGIVKKLNNYN